jgi:F-type H+-transporting ATPase subunit epsilon
MTLNLEIVTPQRILLATEAEYVTITGEIGELGILPGHIPLLTNLQSGILSYKTGNIEEKIAVHSGYAEVSRDKITILAKTAELKADIDLERSKAALQSAEKELEEALKDVDQLEKAVELQQKIKRAITRQQVVA